VVVDLTQTDKKDCYFYAASLCEIAECSKCAYSKEFVPCPSCGKEYWREKPFCPACLVVIPQARKDMGRLKHVKWEGKP
jgi:hypothetical protein